MADRYWVGGTGTWNTTSTTNWSTASGGSSGASVPTAADNVIFDQASTYTVTMTGALTCLSFTVSAGTVTFATGTTPTLAISGSLSIVAATVWNSTGAITFNSTTGTSNITTNGVTINASITFNGVGGTWQLQTALTIGSTNTTTLTAGTLNLNGLTLTTGLFNSSGTTTRVLAFGVGNITVNGSGTVWETSTLTGFSITGTPTVNISNNTATATTVNTGLLTEAQSMNFNYTTGTYTLTDTNARYRSLNLTGFSGTFQGTARRFWGGFNAGTTVTIAAGTGNNIFQATSGTWDIVTNGKALNFPITFDGIGGTWRLLDALTTGTARTTTLTNGTLNLNGFSLTTGAFSSNGLTARTIAFGAGSITVNGTGTVWDTGTVTNLTITGTPTVNISNNSATATTVTTGTLLEAQSMNFNYTTGTYTLTDTGAVYKSINLTGFSGTYANNARTYYGGFNAGSTATMTAGINAQTFAATSGTWNLVSNGRTLDFPLTFNGVGGTWQLQDALIMGTTRAMTLTNGTIDANNFNVTLGSFTSRNSNVRTIATGSGTWTVAGTGSLAWDMANSTNATATGNATINMTGATTKRFESRGLSWGTLNQGGAGTLEIYGFSTFNDITSTYTATGACTISFLSGQTNTVNNFTASGTAGKILTINATTTGSQATLTKTGGTVSVSYCSIQDSVGTGGATWKALLTNNNTNAGNNTGWLFVDNSSNFFLVLLF